MLRVPGGRGAGVESGPGSSTAAGPPGGKRCLLPASFVLHFCRSKPHQRCQGLSTAFRFKAKFPAVRSLSSNRNPNSPPRVTPGQALRSKPSCYKAKCPSRQVTLSHRGDRLRFGPPCLGSCTPQASSPPPQGTEGALGPRDPYSGVALSNKLKFSPKALDF